MTITSTAVSFIALSIGLGFCGWRFLNFPKPNKTAFAGHRSHTGFLLGSFLLLFALENLILGFGALLFSQCENFSTWILILANTLLPIIAILGIYIVYYVFFPRSKLL